MSTRCQVRIKVNNKELMLYHHFDGYPEGVGYCLLKLMEQYKSGCWFQSIINDMVKRADFEITFINHGDIEYLYEMDFDKKVVLCYSVDNWENHMKILETIPLVYDETKDCNVDKQLFRKEA